MLERVLYVRERSDGLYHASTYLMFKMGTEVLVGVFVALIFALLVRHGGGQMRTLICAWLATRAPGSPLPDARLVVPALAQL